jgi:head-tail adaptor
MSMIAPSRRIAATQWRVIIEELIETIGPSGAPVTLWQPIGNVLMTREVETVVERALSDQVLARETTTWFMPWTPWMDPDVIDVPKVRRLKFSGRNYDISGAQRDGELGQRIQLLTTTSSKADQPQRSTP